MHDITTDIDDLVRRLAQLLTEKQLLIATAESCTGGLIGHSLTNVSGSSAYYDRGVIVYSNRAKQALLGVPETLLVKYGAVSEQVAEAMATGIRSHSQVELGIATTGIAGPTGGTKEKPVGLVYIGIATTLNTTVYKHIFTGTRLEIKKQSCYAALTHLLDHLQDTR